MSHHRWFARERFVHSLSTVRRAGQRSLRFEPLENRRLLTATATGDFNGDGRADFANGLPYEDIHVNTSSDLQDAGIVQILYGTATGLSSAGNQLWQQNSPGIADSVEDGDLFGWAVAAADFNNDGFDDLAIGIPGEDLSGVSDAGAVQILYGSTGGLASPATPGANFFHRNLPQMGVLPVPDSYRYGWTLSAGDFDGDGDADLAVGVPFENVNGHTDAGLVQILNGSAGGITSVGNQIWHQDSPGIANSTGDYEEFGASLSAGDFDGDGDDDLAIGVPFDSLVNVSTVGTVHVLKGGVGGLSSTGSQLWHQNIAGMPEVAESYDGFGASLASGDYNNDGKDDLIIGVPYEATSGIYAGAFHVLYGTATSLSVTGTQLLHQNSPGVLDQNGSGDLFGYSLQGGDFNGDGSDDIAVGSPGEAFGSTGELQDVGNVHVFYGGLAGITTTGTQLWHQNSTNILDVAEVDDRFGYYLAAGDFDGDGRDDLAIDVPSEDLGQSNSIPNAGALNVIYGTISGLDSLRNQFWTQNSPDVLDSAEAYDGWPGPTPALAAASANWWNDIELEKIRRSRRLS